MSTESTVAIRFSDHVALGLVDEALIVSEIRYRRLFEAARDGILILDAETGEITDVNPFLIELLGCSRADFLFVSRPKECMLSWSKIQRNFLLCESL